MMAVLADPALFAFTGDGPPTETDLAERYRRQSTTPGWLNWVLRTHGSGEVVGTVQATQRDERAAELAWVIGVPWQGHGYASEAVRSVVAALRAAGSRHLVAHVHPGHEASRRVAERAGLAPTGEVVDGEAVWEWRAPG